MDLDKFKAGSWWLIERGEYKWMFMVEAHTKRTTGHELAIHLCSAQTGWNYFTHDTLAISAMPNGTTIVPLPNRQAALDLLHILWRNHE